MTTTQTTIDTRTDAEWWDAYMAQRREGAARRVEQLESDIFDSPWVDDSKESSMTTQTTSREDTMTTETPTRQRIAAVMAARTHARDGDFEGTVLTADLISTINRIATMMREWEWNGDSVGFDQMEECLRNYADAINEIADFVHEVGGTPTDDELEIMGERDHESRVGGEAIHVYADVNDAAHEFAARLDEADLRREIDESEADREAHEDDLEAQYLAGTY